MSEELFLFKKAKEDLNKEESFIFFEKTTRLIIMVAITVLNGNDYVSCDKCGSYELYEVSRLHRVQDGAKQWLCRQCIPVSCMVVDNTKVN